MRKIANTPLNLVVHEFPSTLTSPISVVFKAAFSPTETPPGPKAGSHATVASSSAQHIPPPASRLPGLSPGCFNYSLASSELLTLETLLSPPATAYILCNFRFFGKFSSSVMEPLLWFSLLHIVVGFSPTVCTLPVGQHAYQWMEKKIHSLRSATSGESQ